MKSSSTSDPGEGLVLDLRGMIIPLTLLKITQGFRKMEEGEIMEIIGSDLDTRRDFLKVLGSSPCEVLSIRDEKDRYLIRLRKGKAGFSHIAVVSCGTLSMELTHLRKEGFLDAEQLLFTTPGFHEDPRELERQLVQRIHQAKEEADQVLIVYGGKFCYVNSDHPTRTMGKIIEEQGPQVARVEATHCMDMLASESEREKIANEIADGEKVWWMTPGWIQFRHQVFKGWDQGLANENFPRHTGGAIVLDGIGYVDRYMAEHPEEFLEYSDWMGIPIQGYTVTLDRFKSLLLEGANRLREAV